MKVSQRDLLDSPSASTISSLPSSTIPTVENTPSGSPSLHSFELLDQPASATSLSLQFPSVHIEPTTTTSLRTTAPAIAVLPIPQPAPTHIAMPSDRVEPFDGDDPSRNARQFLRDVELQFTDQVQDKQIIRRFGLLLKADSTADKWYDEWTKSNSTIADKWASVSAAFEAKFGRTEKKVFTRKEAFNILRSMIEDIDADKLGSYDQASRMDYHVLQLDRIAREAEKMGCADDMVEEVKAKLPKALGEMLEKEGKVEKWEELRKTSEKVKAYKLKEALDEEKAKEQKKEEDEARLQQLDAATRRMDAALRDLQQGRSIMPASPTAALRQGIQSIPLGRPASQQYAQLNNSNPFITSEQPRSGNLFAPQPRRLIPNHIRLRNLRQNTAGLTHHTLDEAGLTAYRAQVEEWRRRNPTTRNPDETRPYPLKPGTAELGSRECYRCGQIGHRLSDCQNAPLDELETSWRRTASYIIRNAAPAAGGNGVAPAPLNAVMVAHYPYYDTSQVYQDYGGSDAVYSNDYANQGNF